jgi:hypothetical protein
MPGFRIARPQGEKAYAAGGKAREFQAEVARQKSNLRQLFFAALAVQAGGAAAQCAVLFGRCPVLIIATVDIINGTEDK